MKILKLPLLMLSLTLLAGCGGGVSYNGGGSGGGSSGGSDNNNANANTTFNVKHAVALVANQDLIEETANSVATRSVKGKKGHHLFAYRIKKAGVLRDSSGNTSGGTNLLAVDENGDAQPAVESDLPIKVMYAITSPDGNYVYLALDNGWFNPGGDGHDYSRFIAANNCSLFKVSLTDNSSECAAPGLYVQSMNDNYMKAISGNQKPIQFDSAGNMYFAASSFTTSSNSWCTQYDNNHNCTSSHTDYSIQSATWNPRIYKRNATTGAVTAMTQDNENVQFFLVLPSGELAFQSWNSTSQKNELAMLQGSQRIDLTNNNWGVDFFTVDSYNTVIFGQGDWTGNGHNGLRFARPHDGGGVEKASLDTSLFGADTTGQQNGWGNPKPRRIILGDDGRIYGVFEGGRNKFKANGQPDGYEQVLTVYQMLPYDGVPKAELTISNNDWWAWMSDTPFQISRGYLYYKETKDVPFYGTADVIRMLNLSTRETTTLLDPSKTTDHKRYTIYNWRLSGTTVYFSALDKNTNTVVTGQIDTVKVRDGLADDALTIQQTASALGAASAIQDIEILKPQAPTVDTGSKPSVLAVYQDSDNPYSMSVDFTKYMDKSSVESNIALTSGNATQGPDGDGVIPMMKVWLYQTLHLIPDLDGLGDSTTTTPMSANTTYTLSFGAGIRDIFSWDLNPTDNSAVTIRPDHGWYASTLRTQTDADIASSKVLRYAGPDTAQALETYDLGAVPSNVRIEFSAKNAGWEGLQLLLWDADSADSNVWMHKVWLYRLNGWTSLEYKTAGQFGGVQGQWDSTSTPDIFNGNFRRYRIDTYGGHLVLSYSTDGTTFTEVSDLSKDDLVDRTAHYHLMLRLREAMQLDNLTISTLDAEGALATTVGDVASFNFDNNAVPGVFSRDVTNNYNLENW